ncbi:uncharacterized protein LOC135089708 isoform X9 [Scylla paramamosain]|uniref:uncharacterized protein LOC135089708 isoform X9 n=1 Tax=Scylla paramamosain TaxID=85552 RepID=UPI00308316B9
MTTSSARRGRHWPQYNVTKSRHSCKLGKETRSPDNVQGNLTSSPCHLLSSCVSQKRLSGDSLPDPKPVMNRTFGSYAGEDEHT